MGGWRRHIEGWRRIGAPPVIVRWIKYGVPLRPGKGRTPIRRRWRNKVLPGLQTEWFEGELRRLLRVGAVRRASPGVVKAYSYVKLEPKPGPKMFRAVFAMLDLNDTIDKQSVKYETFAQMAQQLNRGDYLITVDMLSGYHHALLSEASVPYTGFEWRGETYVWRVLPFGARPAPRIFTKMVRPLIKYLRASGVRCGVYLDDLYLVHEDAAELRRIRDEVLVPLMETTGTMLQPEKGDWEPTQTPTFLGRAIDTRSMSVHTMTDKAKSIRTALKRCLKKGGTNEQSLASLVGKLEFQTPTDVRLRAWRWPLRRLLPTARKPSRRWVPIEGEAAESARQCLQALPAMVSTGSSISKPTRTITVFTDAATTEGWGVWIPLLGILHGEEWSADERTRHINVLETRAIRLSLEKFGEAMAGCTVVFYCDNVTAVSYVAKGGGTSPTISTEAEAALSAAASHGIWLERPRYVPGSENAVADAASRGWAVEWVMTDPDDWTTAPQVVRRLAERWGMPTVDRFASPANSLCAEFNQAYTHDRDNRRQLAAVDAFARGWNDGKLAWIAAPWHLLDRVVRKAVTEGAEAIILVPSWPSAAWWPQLVHAARDRVDLGPAASVFRPGPSGRFEPGRNDRWQVSAFLL